MLADRVEQRGRLEAVAGLALAGVGDAAEIDRVLDTGHDQPLAEFGDPGVAVGDDLGEVVPGVDVHDREREPPRPERLHGQVQQHGGVLAAAEEEDRSLRLRSDLAQDEDRVGLEEREMIRVVARSVGVEPRQRGGGGGVGGCHMVVSGAAHGGKT